MDYPKPLCTAPIEVLGIKIADLKHALNECTLREKEEYPILSMQSAPGSSEVTNRLLSGSFKAKMANIRSRKVNTIDKY